MLPKTSAEKCKFEMAARPSSDVFVPRHRSMFRNGRHHGCRRCSVRLARDAVFMFRDCAARRK